MTNFKQLIENNGPVQESLIPHLTRWEFRNLLLAGVRVPVSRAFQRRHLKPTRCNENDPDAPGERCANTTESVDEIRACTGHPLWVSNRTFYLKKWTGAQEIRPCLQTERFPEADLDDEPNTDNHPIHSKICRRCRDFYAAEHLDEQRWTMAQFSAPLCKRHSLAQAAQLPLNACRCFAYVNDVWRCRRCHRDSMYYLKLRADYFRKPLMDVDIPWRHPVKRLRSLWAEERLVCPIEGCLRQPWAGQNGKGMRMCLGCNAITSV